MTRRLIALLLVGVLCAGIGLALNGNPFGAPSFGWTAYAPLPSTTYQPVNITWLAYGPRIGLALLAAGAGTVGAAISALVLLRRDETRKTPGN